jgi:divalent metal cation (Fe/Co/Zn/Cd) transporter
LLQRARRLEYFTVGWNLVEGLVAVGAAIAAGSVALLGFGIDSFVESASAFVLIWRLGAEGRAVDHHAIEPLDRRAHQLVGVSLFALAAYIAVDAVWTLYHRTQPKPSIIGIAVLLISIGVMMWLARAKRSAARALASRAMEADAFQTTACWWLSIIGLAGIGLNSAFGWWWADPGAAIGMGALLVREGREAWHGEDCCT